MSDVTFDISNNQMYVHQKYAEDWKVTLVDTGENTFTGGRLKRVKEHIQMEEAFCFTYGDGVSDINISNLVKFHQNHGKWATMTAVQPTGRYGAIDLDGIVIKDFLEKPPGDGGWVNGGFFVLSPRCLELIEGDMTSWEHSSLKKLVDKRELTAYIHHGFWQAMDTLRDKNHLEELWQSGHAPWKIW